MAMLQIRNGDISNNGARGSVRVKVGETERRKPHLFLYFSSAGVLLGLHCFVEMDPMELVGQVLSLLLAVSPLVGYKSLSRKPPNRCIILQDGVVRSQENQSPIQLFFSLWFFYLPYFSVFTTPQSIKQPPNFDP